MIPRGVERPGVLAICAALLLFGGCAVDTTLPGNDDDVPDHAIVSTHVAGSMVAGSMIEPVAPSICDLLPEDGVCARLCEPDGLDDLIPAGTCAVFACALSDGTFVRLHGCPLRRVRE